MSISLLTIEPLPKDCLSPVFGCDTKGALTQAEGCALPEGRAQAGLVDQKLRVLVLEDERIISGRLERAGFSARVTKSGVEALKQIMVTDFAAILCDMSVPGAAGNILYRAIERARPQLCDRFICITERHGEFAERSSSKSPGGYLIYKPVDLEELLDVLTFVQTRTHLSQGMEVRSLVVKNGDPETFAETPVFTQAHSATIAGTNALSGGRPFSWSAIAAIAALLLFAGFSTTTLVGDSELRKRAEGSSSDLALRESQWTETLTRLGDVEQARQRLTALVALNSGIEIDRKSCRWTSGLQSVATAIAPGIELRAFDGRDRSEIQGGFILRLSGTSFSREPRKTADQFRAALEKNLEQGVGRLQVQTRFEHLEESPLAMSNPAVQGRAVFTISATCAPEKSAKIQRK